MKLPNKFRIILTLTASIAVVALLISVLSMQEPGSSGPPVPPNPDTNSKENMDNIIIEPGVAINEETALQISLNHAKLTKTDLLDYTIKLEPEGNIPKYVIGLTTAEYEYKYRISVRYSTIVSAEREYLLPESGENTIFLTEAENIAKSDPMIGEDFRMIQCVLSDDGDCYDVVFQDADSSQESRYQYVLEVSAQGGTVTGLDISYTDITPLRDEDISISNIMPRPAAPEGKYGMYQAIDLAIGATGLPYNRIGIVDCSVASGSEFYTVSFSDGYNKWTFAVSISNGQMLRMVKEPYSVPESAELNLENIRKHLREGMSYADVSAVFGKNHTNLSNDPINDSQRVWFLDEKGFDGTYLQVRFQYPNFATIDQWYRYLNLPEKYDDTETNFLSIWLQGMTAAEATVFRGNEEILTLFSQEPEETTPVDPDNTEGPPVQGTTPTEPTINEQDALYIALDHAGLTKDMIGDYFADQTYPSGFVYYTITFYYKEYWYHYCIAKEGGAIVRATREFREPLDYLHDGQSANVTLTEEDVIRLAKNDPLYNDSLTFLYVSGPYDTNDLDGNSYRSYEVFFKADTPGDPFYVFYICEHHSHVERVIIYCQDESVFE